MPSLPRLRRCAHGQAAIFITLSVPVTFGLLAFVVDVGWAYWRREACKTAAETAGIAAAMTASSYNTYTCGAPGGTTCTAGETACPTSPSPATDALMAGCMYAIQNGFNPTGRQNVTYQANTTPPPVPGVYPAYWIEYTASEQIPTLFAAVLGQSWSQVKARATAAVFAAPKGGCIYALDRLVKAAVHVDGNSNTQATCGVYDNSSDPAALQVDGGGILNAGSATINVAGGDSISNNATVTPNPSLNQNPVPDPFWWLRAPSIPSRCDSTGISDQTNVPATVPADGFVICNGGFNLNGNPTINLPPGLYIIKGGGMNLQNGTITGTGVTFYLTGPAYSGVQINGSMKTTLAAPTSGSYRGVLFFQDRTLVNPAASTLAGGANLNLTGTVYMPTSSITYTGGSSTATSYTGLVGDTIYLKGGSYFAGDNGGGKTGLGVPIVALIE